MRVSHPIPFPALINERRASDRKILRPDNAPVSLPCEVGCLEGISLLVSRLDRLNEATTCKSWLLSFKSLAASPAQYLDCTLCMLCARLQSSADSFWAWQVRSSGESSTRHAVVGHRECLARTFSPAGRTPPSVAVGYSQSSPCPRLTYPRLGHRIYARRLICLSP